MWLSKVVNLLDKVARLPSQVFYRVGGAAIVLMMLLTAVDVILRNLVNRPMIGSFDLMEYMMAVLVASGLAYVAISKANISADVLFTRLSRRTQTFINIITSFLSFGLVCLVAWQTFAEMKSTRDLGLTSAVLLIPVFPFVAVTAFGIALLALVLLKDFFEFLLEVKR